MTGLKYEPGAVQHVYHSRFISTAVVCSAADSNSSCEAFTFSTNTRWTHTTVSLIAEVNECACLSALIVNETLTQIQLGQIFRGQPGDFITDQRDSSGRVIFLYLPGSSTHSRSNSPGLDECGGAGSILPLTDKQCDFNLNHMNQCLPRAGIKYI